MNTRLFSRPCRLAPALIVVLLLAGLGRVAALDITWTGLGTNNYWSYETNWNSLAVAPGDSLFFAGNTRLNSTNDFPAGTVFSNLTFNAGAGAFVLGGNSIALAGNITNNQPLGTETIALDLTPTINAWIINIVSNGVTADTGVISGTSGFTKTGLGRLTLSGANTFAGAVMVAEGTLRVDHDSALGATSGTTIVNSGATLDVSAPNTGVNGLDLGNEQILVTGSGVNGQGAVRSSYANSQINALQMVTLTGDTTFGGTGPWTTSGNDPGRWDIRGTPSTAFLSTGGQPYNLTKLGSNEVRLAGITVDPALANIDIQQGLLAFEGSATSMGNPNSTLTVHPGGTVGFASATNRFNKKFVLIGDGLTFTVDNKSGNNTILGPVTLSNECVFRLQGSGTTLTNRGPISGSGGLTKIGGATGGSTLVLTATNTYTGDTRVSTGTLMLSGTGSISNSPTITVATGAILNASGRTDRTLTIASGQTLKGDGSVLGRLTIAPGGTLSPGDNSLGFITVTSNADFAGVVTMEINRTNTPNCDFIQVVSNGPPSIAYGGTLAVSNLGPALQAGDTFTLFSASNYTRFFAVNDMPPLAAGLAWDTSQLAVNGSVRVAVVGQKTWTGLGPNDYWTYNSNWNSIVVAGDSLFFDGSTRLTPSNNFPAGTVFSNLTFNSGSGAFAITGNWVTVTGNITNNQASGTETIGFDLVLPANGFIHVVSNDFVNVVSNGFIHVVSNGSLTISGDVSGAFGLIKTGLGRLTLGGANPYIGDTRVHAGTLALSSNGSFSNSPTITVAAGAILDASGRTDRTFTVNSGQALTGDGSLLGRLTIAPGGTLTPGENSLGFITVTSNADFAGVVTMEINRTNSPNCDFIHVVSNGPPSITYGGTLTVSNLGPPLQAGDTFTLFSATNYSGFFDTEMLPSLTAGLVWDTSGLATNGSIRVASSSGVTNYTVPIQPGLNLIANQFDHGSNRADVIFPNPTGDLDGNILLKWNCGGFYNMAMFDSISGTGFSDAVSGAPIPAPTLNVGEAFFFNNQSGGPLTLTFTGTPHVPVLPATLPCGLGQTNYLARQTPDLGTYDNIIGLPPTQGAQEQIWNGTGFTIYTFNGGAWTPTNPPSLSVGQGAVFVVPATPVITCPASITVQCGSTWSFDTPTATGGCGGNITITILSTVTNGTCPMTATRTWRATDLCGGTAQCSQTVTLVEPTFPIITQPLHTLVVTQGQTATFTIGTVGAPPLAFQWYLNGAALPSANAQTLVIPAVTGTNAGYYQVTVSNAYGSTISGPGLLRIQIQDQNQGGDPGGPTGLDFGDLPGPYAACWKYAFYGPYGTDGSTCLPITYSTFKVASSVPVTYPTLLQDNGARHYCERDEIWLGTDVTPTQDGTPSSLAKLDPTHDVGSGVTDFSKSAVLKEENGVRIIPSPFSTYPIAIGQNYLVDPRTNAAGVQGNNVFGRVVRDTTLNYRTCYSPGQTVWFTVEAYNYDSGRYCQPFYLNVWMDYGNNTGSDGTPDGKFQDNGEYVVVDAPLWGVDMLQLLAGATGYPYDSSPLAVRENVASQYSCDTPLPDIGVQPFAERGLQVFSFTIPQMPNLPTCGKKTYARFRISRQPMAIRGANTYQLVNATGAADPSVGLVNDGGEVEDYSLLITKSCSSGVSGSSWLCFQPVTQTTTYQGNWQLACYNCPTCVGDYGPLPAPELIGFSSSLAGGDCEISLQPPSGGWCGTGGYGLGQFGGLVANTGSSNLTGVTVTYPISTNAAQVTGCASQGTWFTQTNTITFQLGDLAPGEEAEVRLSYLPLASGYMNHEFRLAADQPLLNPEDSLITVPNFVTIVTNTPLSCGTNAGNNLVLNGSFESPAVTGVDNFGWFASVPGWTGANSVGGAASVELWRGSYGGMAALDGQQHLEINAAIANETVSQLVTGLQVGCPATLCFAYAGRPGYANSIFGVELSGATTLAVGFNPPSYTLAGWQLYSTTFIPQSSSLLIKFTGASTPGVAGGAHLDNVRLTQTVLPVSIQCPENIQLSVPGNSVVVNYPAPTVTGGGLAACAPPSGSSFPVGHTVVTCIATNGCTMSSCTFTVSVQRASCGTGQNLVLNGSFESPVTANNDYTWTPNVPNWTTTDSQGDFEIWSGNYGGLTSPDGNQHLEINANDGDETVSQVVSGLIPNCTTKLCFYFTGRFPNPSNNTFTVSVVGGGVTPITLRPVAYSVAGWQLYSLTFVPPAPTVTLQFRGHPADGNVGGAHLDKVALSQNCALPAKPVLTPVITRTNLTFSWDWQNYHLESSPTMTGGSNWTPVTGTPPFVVPITGTQRFFRLVSP